MITAIMLALASAGIAADGEQAQSDNGTFMFSCDLADDKTVDELDDTYLLQLTHRRSELKALGNRVHFFINPDKFEGNLAKSDALVTYDQKGIFASAKVDRLKWSAREGGGEEIELSFHPSTTYRLQSFTLSEMPSSAERTDKTGMVLVATYARAFVDSNMPSRTRLGICTGFAITKESSEKLQSELKEQKVAQ
jgi:hypothetical protein